MTDYRLDRLSPRLFEHIVQELAIGAISTTVTPFGDGPDGGREATFEGKTSYGADEAHWQGRGIIQAKYKTRNEGTASDGAWALAQLKSELKQYTRRESPRKSPDYYIFATNVVLPPNEGGTKDKVLNVLAEFAKEYGLKGFDVWDYDKLRILISRDEKVRRSYLAWLSPSDVLAELCDYFQDQKKDYYKIILRYLQNEFLADQYAKLEQAGDSKDEAIPLSQVFIDLPTSERSVSPESPTTYNTADDIRFVSQIIQAAGAKFGQQIDSALPDQIDLRPKSRGGRYVLIGGPGQGKTTISQFACQIFRCEMLKTVPQHLISPEAQAALRNFLSQCEGIYRPAARRLPFRVVLSEFAKYLAEGRVQSLMEFLAMKLGARASISITANDVEKIITEYPAIVVLDGLDEVPPATNRDELMSAVSGFSVDISTGNLDVLIVATSRPQGYNEEFSSDLYTHRYLSPLQPTDAMDYGSRLARIRFGSNEDRYNKVVDRLKRALSKSATVRLMRTPLQVTILTLLVDRMGDPPDERWNLFKDYYQLIYERETERDIPTVAVLKTNRIEIDVIHRRVGVALQVESEKSGGTDARLTVDQFGRLVEDYLREEGHQEPSLANLKRQIIEAAANRLVFLVGLESGWVGFEIRSLQEFMAAEGITDSEDRHIHDRLRAIAASPHWRNVYLFAAGKCFAERRYMRPVIEGICTELNDDPDDESLRLVMAGSELALDLLEDGPARKAPLTRGGMTRLALKLLDGSSHDAAARLAGVCEEETKYIYVEYLKERLFGLDRAKKLSAWNCITYLIDRYGGEFEEIGREIVGKFQLSDDEFSVIVGSASGQNRWLVEVLRGYVKDTAIVLPTQSKKKDRYGPWILSSQPAWFRWYLQLSGGGSRREAQDYLRMSCGSGIIWNYELRLLGDKRNKELLPPSDAPSSGKWAELQAAGEFCANPCKQSLVAALKTITSLDSSQVGSSPMINRYPWPLAEPLLASRNARDAVLDAIESGRYGDIDDWLARERRLVDGSDLIEVSTATPILATEDGGLFGFPFRSITGYNFRADAPLSAVERARVLDAFQSADNATVQEFLSLALLQSRVDVPIRQADGGWQNEVIAKLIRNSPYQIFSFWQHIENLDLADRAWVGVFDDFPVRLFTMAYSGLVARPAANTLRRIATAFARNPENVGLLVPLADCLLGKSHPDYRDIPANIDVLPEWPYAIKVAAVVCKIMGGSSVESLAESIIGIREDGEDVVNVIATAVLRRGLDYRNERDELLTLKSIFSGIDWDLEFRLRGNFLRRPSGVAEASEWERLDFPSSLYRLLGV